MGFQRHYVRYAPIWIVIGVLAYIFYAPFSIRRVSMADPLRPLSPEEAEHLRQISSEMREYAE